ncbi:MAG: DUF2169 domain-containing protein [Polyangiales bacterium]
MIRVEPDAAMQVTNQTPWASLAFERRTPRDEPLLVAVLQGRFELRDGYVARAFAAQGEVDLTDTFRGDPRTTSLRREGALATYKPATDVHVDAVARAPGNVPSAAWTPRIAVGERVMDLRVTGPRWWRHRDGRWQLTPVEPCAEVELSWENAFGGAHIVDGARVAEERNPLGTGLLPPGLRTDADVRAPQVLHPGDPTELVAGERYAPHGCAPLGRDTAWRLPYAGTYDERWRRERWPRLPDDFDARFYNSAHPSLVCAPWLRGDERIGLRHLTPEGEFRTALPGVGCALDVYDDLGRAEAVPMPLDTIHLDVASPGARTLTLTWRACVPMRDGLSRAVARPTEGVAHHG